MGDPDAGTADSDPDPLGTFRGFFALSGDVFVLSVAMFAFSLGFQTTGRHVPVYLDALGASAVVVGLYRTVGDLVGAVYPYPGGAVSDRVGSRTALTAFGLASTVGFVVWGAGDLDGVAVGPTNLAVVLLFLGLFLSEAWKSFGLGATFAVVKQTVPPSRLAAGFASTETFRRTAFLLGPLLAAGVSPRSRSRRGSGCCCSGPPASACSRPSPNTCCTTRARTASGSRSRGSTRSGATSGRSPTPSGRCSWATRSSGSPTGWCTRSSRSSWSTSSASVSPSPSWDGSPPPRSSASSSRSRWASRCSRWSPSHASPSGGLKPVVALGFAVDAVFPVLLVTVPRDGVSLAGATLSTAGALVVLFAPSGLRFAGLPAHKALIVGPAETGAGGRVTGSYYLVRNAVVVPSGLVGGYLYGASPTTAFAAATAVGLVGTGYFLVRGEEFGPYARA